MKTGKNHNNYLSTEAKGNQGALRLGKQGFRQSQGKLFKERSIYFYNYHLHQ